MTDAAPAVPDQESHPLGLVAAAVAVVAWSNGPIIVRAIGQSVATIIFWRLWIAVPVMAAAAYVSGGRLSWGLTRVALWPGVLFGASMVLGFESFNRTSIANATLIPALLPALMMVAATRLFGEVPDKRQRLLALGAFAGMAIVVFGAQTSSGADWVGDVLAAGNLLLFSVYFVRVKQIRDRKINAAAFLATVFLVAAVVVTPWSLATSPDLGALGAKGWVLVLTLVVGTGMFGHLAMTWAQGHLSITIASLLTLGQPVISSFMAWLIEHESLAPVQFVGAALAIGALAMIVLGMRGAVPEVQTALSVPIE